MTEAHYCYKYPHQTRGGPVPQQLEVRGEEQQQPRPQHRHAHPRPHRQQHRAQQQPQRWRR